MIGLIAALAVGAADVTYGEHGMALFGGPQPRSAVENNMLQVAHAERSALGARSVAGDPQTAVVSRGTLVQTMLALPAGDGQEASIALPN